MKKTGRRAPDTADAGRESAPAASQSADGAGQCSAVEAGSAPGAAQGAEARPSEPVAGGGDGGTKKRSSSLVSKGLSLSVLTLFSRILGLVREMTKAAFLGTSSFSDAFGIAFMIPNLFRRLFAENSISVAFIPTFKNYLEESSTPEGRSRTQDFVSAVFTLVTFLTASFVTLGMIFTPWIVRIFYPDSGAFDEAVVLTRIMFPYLFVISIAAFFQGILNALKIFSPSGFTPILFNAIVIIATYVLSPHMQNPARAMAVGVITGGTVQALFQLPFVVRTKWRLVFTSLRKAFSNPGSRRVFRLIGPTIIGMAGYQLNDIVSSALATRAGEGVVSSLQYSLRLQELILGICAVTIGTVILPDLTGFAKNRLWDKFSSLLTNSIRIISLITIPVTVYALSMGENIITLVFASGRFDAESVRMTREVFDLHIAGLFFIAVNRIVSPAFYAQQDTKSPTIAGLINFAVNIALASLLVGPFGGRGIALALTVASAANTALLFVFLGRKREIGAAVVARHTILYALKMALFSLVAVVPVLLMRRPLCAAFAGRSRLVAEGVPILITALAFAAVGVALLAVSRDPILKTIINKITRRKA